VKGPLWARGEVVLPIRKAAIKRMEPFRRVPSTVGMLRDSFIAKGVPPRNVHQVEVTRVGWIRLVTEGGRAIADDEVSAHRMGLSSGLRAPRHARYRPATS
jgi:hypothetical protein